MGKFVKMEFANEEKKMKKILKALAIHLTKTARLASVASMESVREKIIASKSIKIKLTCLLFKFYKSKYQVPIFDSKVKHRRYFYLKTGFLENVLKAINVARICAPLFKNVDSQGTAILVFVEVYPKSTVEEPYYILFPEFLCLRDFCRTKPCMGDMDCPNLMRCIDTVCEDGTKSGGPCRLPSTVKKYQLLNSITHSFFYIFSSSSMECQRSHICKENVCKFEPECR